MQFPVGLRCVGIHSQHVRGSSSIVVACFPTKFAIFMRGFFYLCWKIQRKMITLKQVLVLFLCCLPCRNLARHTSYALCVFGDVLRTLHGQIDHILELAAHPAQLLVLRLEFHHGNPLFCEGVWICNDVLDNLHRRLRKLRRAGP